MTELFIWRPVSTTLFVASLLVFGIAGYLRLPVSDLPTIDFPTIQVSASLPGAGPAAMAASVATPLEKQFATIAGITSMSSSSSQGNTSITLQFGLDRSIDAAAQDVQSMIARAARDLPPDMPAPPSFRKVNPADSPVLFLTLSSTTLPLSEVNHYAETVLGQRLSMAPGVAQVNVYGSQRFAVRVDVDPAQLAARELGLNEVARAIAAANVNRPTGMLYGPERNYRVQSEGQLLDADGFGTVVVAYRNGAAIRLDEVAHVYDGVENRFDAGWSNGTPAVYLSIRRQPGANTVAVVDGVKSLLPQLQSTLPAGVTLGIRSDRAESIRESVDDIKFTMLLTVALVILVIFVFLGSLSATVIPSLALPLSIVGTFAVMWSMGFSLDNLSLMALTLSVGFVVDDAIVMLENIVRHREMGKSRMQAAVDGAREIAFTIVSMTLSLTAVFIPILFMGGVVGRLMREFAVTIAAAVLVSGVVSLTLTPMLCSRYLGEVHRGPAGRFSRLTEGAFDAALGFYRRTLAWSLRYRAATLAVSLLLIAGTVRLFAIVPTGFIPSVDTGQLSGDIEAIEGVGFETLEARTRQVMEVLEEDPDVANYTANIGGGGGRLNVDLRPRHERDLSADEIIEALRPKLDAIPGLRVFLSNPPAIRIGGRPSRSEFQFTLQGGSLSELHQVVPEFEAALRQLPGIQDVSSDLQVNTPQLSIELDREQIAALGLTVDEVELALSSAYGERQVSKIFAPDDQYAVIMQVAPEYQRDPTALSRLHVAAPGGRQVPLASIASVALTTGAQSVNHAGQLPAVTLSFNLKPGVSLGEAVADVEELARGTLPRSITASFQGTAQAFQESMRGLGWVLVLAIFVIYVVLGVLYESFIHPLTILSGLPAAGFGALLTLLLFGEDLNIYAFVGIIMLVGLVKKNGIIMIDFAVEARRERRLPATDAIQEACLVRFRPIMMTTMAALMGTLPIALGWGAGAEARRSLGLAVVGGLLVSQTLTLYITPVFYTYLDGWQQWLERRREYSAATPSTMHS